MAKKCKVAPALPSGSAPVAAKPPSFLSPRTVTVNGHCVGSSRNRCEPVARLRDCGASGHNKAHLLHGSGDSLLCCRLHYNVLARISSECRCAKCQCQHGACASDRPAARATASASCIHAASVMPRRILCKLIRLSSSYFYACPLSPASAKECFSPSKENVRGECCSDALLLLRCGRLRLPRAYRRSRRQIPTSNLPPAIERR